MATLAERFRAQQQRTGVAKRKPRHPHKAPVGELAKGRVPNPASHNEATRAERTAAYEFEVALTNRPSRMSSRPGHNRERTDVGLRIATTNRNRSPESRAMRHT
jgi:hypothetical protein